MAAIKCLGERAAKEEAHNVLVQDPQHEMRLTDKTAHGDAVQRAVRNLFKVTRALESGIMRMTT